MRDAQTAGYRDGSESEPTDEFLRLAAKYDERRRVEQAWMDTHHTDPVFSAEPINWPLIERFAGMSHPVMNDEYVRAAVKAAGEFGFDYLGESAQGERVCHHLLDMIGVPCPLPSVGGAGHPADLDARVWRAVVGVHALQERLARIATWHSQETGPAGTVGDYCNECGHIWPCDTYRMANGDWTDEDDDDLADVLGVQSDRDAS